MNLGQMIFKSLKQHLSSTLLSIVSIALGFSLLLSVISLREQTHKQFTANGSGVDGVLAPKGSPLQIILNSIFHMEEMPGTIPWSYYEKVLESDIVEDGIPFCTGHSYGGYRVNAIDSRFFSDFEFRAGKKFSFNQGHPFQRKDEAVVGWVVAKNLNLKIGDIFNPVCGVDSGDPVHINDHIKIVGVMEPTGTPHDKALYISLEGFYSLNGHNSKMSIDKSYRDISGAYLKIRRVRNGAIHPGIQELQYNINQSSKAQFVLPGEVLPKLISIIGWVDKVLFIISIAIIIISLLFLFSSLLSSMKDRRRDIALLRSLGGSRRFIFTLTISESIIISLLGGVLGFLLSRVILFLSIDLISIETGMHFDSSYISQLDILFLPLLLLSGFLAGIIPSIQAYRAQLLNNLRQLS